MKTVLTSLHKSLKQIQLEEGRSRLHFRMIRVQPWGCCHGEGGKCTQRAYSELSAGVSEVRACSEEAIMEGQGGETNCTDIPDMIETALNV